MMNGSEPRHIPVLLEEVITWLEPSPGMTIADGTLGGGGHAAVLARRVSPGGRLIALDRDAAAIARAEHRLKGLPILLAQRDYRDLAELLKQLEIDRVDAVLLDLGLSSDQLSDSRRGFSFDCEGPLDLRFDVSEGEPAWRLLDRLSAESLANILYRYGEERFSRRIARKVVETRKKKPIRTAAELARIVRSCVPHSRDRSRIDPATRTFQALRIAVNDELGALETALRQVPDLLAPHGRMAVISFHSLEDRLVKHAFRDNPKYEVLTKKPVRPTDAETARNPRARSAKMRVAARRA